MPRASPASWAARHKIFSLVLLDRRSQGPRMARPAGPAWDACPVGGAVRRRHRRPGQSAQERALRRQRLSRG